MSQSEPSGSKHGFEVWRGRSGRKGIGYLRQGLTSGLFRLEGRLGIQRYRITAEGFALLAIIVLVGAAAWHSGTNLLYLVFAVLISAFCAHGLLVYRALRSITVERRFPHHIFASKATVIDLTITNRRRYLDGFALRLMDYDEDGEARGAAFVAHVPSRGTASTSYAVTFARRGVYRLVAIETVTRFPFGIIERGYRQRIVDELIVYPPIREYASFYKLFVDGFGEFDMPERGPGTELYGLREYVPGEHARHIHWRSSARTRKLMVMEYERDERRNITIVLWNEVSEHLLLDSDTLVNFESAVEFAASLAYYLINSSFEVRLLTASGQTAKGYGFGHLYEILRALAQLQLQAGESEPRLPSDRETAFVRITYGPSSEEGTKAAPGLDITLDAIRFDRDSPLVGAFS